MSEALLRLLLPMALAGSALLAVAGALRLAGALKARGWRAALVVAALVFVLPVHLLATGVAARGLQQQLGSAPATAPAYGAGQELARQIQAPQPAATEPDHAAAKTEPAHSDAAAPAALALSLWPLVYLAGLGAAALLFWGRYGLFLRRLRRRVQPVTHTDTLALYQALCKELGVRRPPALCTGAQLTTPLLAGCLRPLLVLPETMPQSEETLALALRHELTHYRSGDVWLKHLVMAGCTLHWYNPLAHGMRRWFALACEQRCDALVCSALDARQRLAYAHTLVDQAAQRLPALAVGFASPAGKLKQRLALLLRPTKERRALRATAAGLLAVCTAAALCTSCSFAAGSASSPAPAAASPAAATSQPAPSQSDSSFAASSSAFTPQPGDPGVATGTYIWPVPEWKYSSRGASSYHRGRDINAETGAAILAMDGGTVEVAEFHYSWGNYIRIDHGNGIQTMYAHCHELFVQVGEQVGQGQHIASVGSTGMASGPALHLEVWLNGAWVDPDPYLDWPKETPEAMPAF